MCLPLAKCCCCVSLEIGAQIVSIGSLVLSSVLLLVYATAVALLPLTPIRTWTYSVLASHAGLQLLLGCLLAAGSFTRKPYLLVPWLVSALLSSAILLTLSVAGAGILLSTGRGDAHASVMVSAYFLYAAVQYYFACVVSSRRRELMREEKASESEHSLMGKRVTGSGVMHTVLPI